jgi:hypothetical protein
MTSGKACLSKGRQDPGGPDLKSRGLGERALPARGAVRWNTGEMCPGGLGGRIRGPGGWRPLAETSCLGAEDPRSNWTAAATAWLPRFAPGPAPAWVSGLVEPAARSPTVARPGHRRTGIIGCHGDGIKASKPGVRGLAGLARPATPRRPDYPGALASARLPTIQP